MQIAVSASTVCLDVHRHRLPACRTARCRRPGSRCARSATSGSQGSTDFAPIARARFLVLTCWSPCISTISGRAALVLHHQRLDHRVLVDAELARRLGRAAVLDVVVDVLGERDARAAQELRRRGLADVMGFFAMAVTAVILAPRGGASGRFRPRAAQKESTGSSEGTLLSLNTEAALGTDGSPETAESPTMPSGTVAAIASCGPRGRCPGRALRLEQHRAGGECGRCEDCRDDQSGLPHRRGTERGRDCVHAVLLPERPEGAA